MSSIIWYDLMEWSIWTVIITGIILGILDSCRPSGQKKKTNTCHVLFRGEDT